MLHPFREEGFGVIRHLGQASDYARGRGDIGWSEENNIETQRKCGGRVLGGGGFSRAAGKSKNQARHREEKTEQ